MPSILSLLHFTWKELSLAVVAALLAVFLAFFGQRYGATEAAPLYAIIPAVFAVVLPITAWIKVWPLLGEEHGLLAKRTTIVATVTLAITCAIAGAILQRYGFKVYGSWAYGIAAAAMFAGGFIFPICRPHRVEE